MESLCERDPWYNEMKRNKREEDMRTLIADGDYGLPVRCACGGRIINEISPEAPPIGRKYLTCNAFKNDGLHIWKCWELGIEEEVIKLRKDFDEKSNEGRIELHDFYIKQLRSEMEIKDREIANLKDLVGKLLARIEKLELGHMP